MGLTSLQFTRKDIQRRIKQVAEDIKNANIKPTTVDYVFNKGEIDVKVRSMYKKIDNTIHSIKVKPRYTLKELEDLLYYEIQPHLKFINTYGYIMVKEGNVKAAIEDFVKRYRPDIKLDENMDIKNPKHRALYNLTRLGFTTSIYTHDTEKRVYMRLLKVMREVSFKIMDEGGTLLTSSDWERVLIYLARDFEKGSQSHKFTREQARLIIEDLIIKGEWDKIFKEKDEEFVEEFYNIFDTHQEFKIYDMVYDIKNLSNFVNNGYADILDTVDVKDIDVVENLQNLTLFNYEEDMEVIAGVNGDSFFGYLDSWGREWDELRQDIEEEKSMYGESSREDLLDELDVGIDYTKELINNIPKSQALKEKWGGR